nr:MAG TPA: Poly(beta-D-mannuronate) C5 epimerase 4 [Caudoviricetes sp.]
MSFENFPYSNFHDLNLDWIINQWRDMKKSFATYEEAFKDLKSFVDNYFNNLDVQEEINHKLDDLLNSGRLDVVLSLFIPYVTPEMFGAHGDGIHDDTTALLSAFASGKTVFLNSGSIYLFSKQLIVGNIIGNNARIKSLVIDKAVEQNVGLILVKSNSTITDVTFDGGMLNPGQKVTKHTYNNPSYDGHPILRELEKNMSNVIIKNCTFINSTHMSIEFNNAEGRNVTIENCTFKNSNRDSIFVYCNDLKITNNVIINGEDNYIAIDGSYSSLGVSNILINNNMLIKDIVTTNGDSISASSGIFVYGDKNYIDNVQICNNTITSNYQGMRLNHITNLFVNSNDIRCGGLGHVVTTKTWGIHLEYCPECCVKNCSIKSLDYGLYIGAECTDGRCEYSEIDCPTNDILKSFSRFYLRFCYITSSFSSGTIDCLNFVLIFCNITCNTYINGNSTTIVRTIKNNENNFIY